jgi:hypothetical protein
MHACGMNRHAYMHTCGVNRCACVRTCGDNNRALEAKLRVKKKLIFLGDFLVF